MILYKYIFKEILKTQIITLIVLLVVFLSQSMIRLISRAAVGSVPVDIITNLAAYAVPEIAMIMLPLTLFLACLITLGRICSDSEMVVMRSIGFSPANVMTIAMILAFFTSIVTAFNCIYLVPWASNAKETLMKQTENNPQFLPIESGKFSSMGGYNIYIENVEEKSDGEKNIAHVFVMEAPFANVGNSMTIADKGYLMHDENGVLWLELDKGSRYEVMTEDGTSNKAIFDKFRTPVAGSDSELQEDDSISSRDTFELLHSGETRAVVEAQWRLSPIFAVFILTFVAIPLSMVNPRQGRFARLMPAILIYASYYMFLLSCRNMINSGSLPLYPGLFVVPVVFFLFVGLPLNLPRNFWKLLRAKKEAK